MAATIRPGMRACAVRVDDVVGVAGFVTPGHAGGRTGVRDGSWRSASADGPKVKTLLQNIEVLSAGTNIQKDNEGKAVKVAVVNLLVTPEQAELLSLASSQTKIQLVLRNPWTRTLRRHASIAMASRVLGRRGSRKAEEVLSSKNLSPGSGASSECLSRPDLERREAHEEKFSFDPAIVQSTSNTPRIQVE